MMKKNKESCQILPKAISIATIRNGKPKQFMLKVEVENVIWFP